MNEILMRTRTYTIQVSHDGAGDITVMFEGCAPYEVGEASEFEGVQAALVFTTKQRGKYLVAFPGETFHPGSYTCDLELEETHEMTLHTNEPDPLPKEPLLELLLMDDQ